MSTTNRRRTASTRKPSKNVKIIPLGGLDQIGQNMTLIECDNEIVIIDCGLAFPGDEMPGIDLIIPNFEYLRQNYDKN